MSNTIAKPTTITSIEPVKVQLTESVTLTASRSTLQRLGYSRLTRWEKRLSRPRFRKKI
jgi:hypothetical protein